jgi:hypothetical protein
MRPAATGVGGVTELAAAEVGGDAEPAAWAGVGGRDLEHAVVGTLRWAGGGGVWMGGGDRAAAVGARRWEGDDRGWVGGGGR